MKDWEQVTRRELASSNAYADQRQSSIAETINAMGHDEFETVFEDMGDIVIRLLHSDKPLERMAGQLAWIGFIRATTEAFERFAEEYKANK